MVAAKPLATHERSRAYNISLAREDQQKFTMFTAFCPSQVLTAVEYRVSMNARYRPVIMAGG